MNAVVSVRQAACDAVGFAAIGPATGNLTIGRGALDGQALHVAIVENRIASGSIGVAEAGKLASLFKLAAIERSPLVVCLDSAGARVSEGLAALGAFRRAYSEGLRAQWAGAPMAFVLGANCFGGASLFAQLGAARLFSPGTRLAMSGPSILAQMAGGSALDETMRAVVVAAIGAEARAQGDGNTLWRANLDVSTWLRQALSPVDASAPAIARHARLGAQLPKAAPASSLVAGAAVLEHLFPEGRSLQLAGGVLSGTAMRDGVAVPVIGLLGETPVGAATTWRFAELAWAASGQDAASLEVVLDCESHATRLEDERLGLSEYLADAALALASARERGLHVRLTVIGDAGGGVYVALAAPASRVSVAVGATIHVLPASAMASILGADPETPASPEDHLASGVADDEVGLGLIE